MKIKVAPANNLFKELRNQSIDFKASIFELIDNSIAAISGTECNVIIELSGNWNKGKTNNLDKTSGKIIIKDDSFGIDISMMEKVLSPAAMAGMSKNPMNRHGMGLKNALISIGTKFKNNKDGELESIVGFSILTKTANNPTIYEISSLAYGEIDIKEYDDECQFDNGHGTIITIEYLNNVLTAKNTIRTFLWSLGYRYSTYLKGLRGKKLNLKVIFSDKNRNPIFLGSEKCDFTIKPVDISYRSDAALCEKTLTSDRNNSWQAVVRFGYAMTEDELKKYDGVGIGEQINASHPLNYKKPSISIIHNDIMLCQKDFNWLYEEFKLSNDIPRMEVQLERGFDTTTIKNDIQQTDSVQELKLAIVDLLKLYMNNQVKITGDERDIKDKLQQNLEDAYDDVRREVSIGYGFKPDFSLMRKGAEEMWEIKRNKVGSPDVGQLMTYLLVSGCKRGVLVARKFDDSAINLAKDCPKKFDIHIELKTLDKFNL